MDLDGRVLRRAREAANLSLRHVAELTGYSVSHLSYAERNAPDRPVTRFLVSQYEQVLGHPIDARVLGPEMKEGDMQRRRVLQGLVASAVVLPGLQAQSGMLLTDLDAALHLPGPAAPTTLAHLEALIRKGWIDFSAVKFRELSVAIPQLVKTASASRAAAVSGQEAAFDALQSAAYVLANELTIKLHAHDVSLMLADRAVQTARASGDPMAIARAQWRLAISLRRSKHRDIAEPIAVAAARKLRDDTGLHDPKQAGFYSRLLCCAAYSAALEGHRTVALGHLDEAQEALLEFPHASELRGFGVDSYQVSIHRIIGEYGTAAESAKKIQWTMLPTSERKTRYLEDTAITMWGAGKPVETYQLLLQTERIAPDEVRLRPWAQRLTVNLLSVPRQSGLRGLRDFADRIGVTATA